MAPHPTISEPCRLEMDRYLWRLDYAARVTSVRTWLCVPVSILELDSGSPRVGANLVRQKTTAVLAHFICHEFVQQGVHAQDEVLVVLWGQGQIARLERIVPQVKELDVVVVQNLFQRRRRIEVGRGVV